MRIILYTYLYVCKYVANVLCPKSDLLLMLSYTVNFYKWENSK